jgi:uncharacterized protein (TIGR02271 family)
MKAHIDPKDLIGHKLVDEAGTKIGTIDQVYLDDQTREPEWVSVNTGMFGGRGSFVPLENAHSAGEDFQVPYDKGKIKEAPPLDVDSHLSVADEERLYQYYGVSGHGQSGPTGDTRGAPPPAAGTAGKERPADSRATDPAVARAPRRTEPSVGDAAADTTMTRSEEQLRVDTERYESGHVRLHKYVVTETTRENVPISHEEVQVEREPITAENRGTVTDAKFGEAERDVVLHAERAVPHKETMPVERVRLRTRQVREEVPVAEELRKERIEVENEAESMPGKASAKSPGEMPSKERPT